MNKKFLQVIAVCVCFFTACGNNSSTNSTSSFSNSSSVEVSANQEEQEKTDSEAKTDLTEKYKNILEALENEEYDKAIDLISAMKPEPETEVVTIDLNNWTEYFTVEIENENLNYDAMKNIISEGESMNLVIKPEYKERIISVNGEVGAEVAYEDLVYKVINVNRVDIQYAIKKVVKKKATSWDLIPGKAIKNAINLIKKEELNIVYNNISKVFNRYLKPEVIPNEMTISRLFCLNKKADEVGNVDNLRPIAISSTFIKMIESAINTRLRLVDEINEKKLICNKQIGFIKGCGTELNLLR